MNEINKDESDFNTALLFSQKKSQGYFISNICQRLKSNLDFVE